MKTEWLKVCEISNRISTVYGAAHKAAAMFGMLCFAAFVGCQSFIAGGKSAPSHPEDLQSPPIEFSVPQIERFIMPNGLVIYYRYNSETPDVRGTLYLPGGGLWDPPKLAGLARAAGAQLRDGGTEQFNAHALDEHLDRLAASIDSSFGDEYGNISFYCLAEDFKEVFSVLSQILQKPAFEEPRLALWKKLAVDNIRRRRDNPETIAEMAFRKLVYGLNSPYAAYPSAESVSLISRQELRAFQRRFVRPDGAILALSGALSLEELKQALNEHFSNWPKGAEPLPQYPPAETAQHAGVYFLPREFGQVTVKMGHLGPPRNTADSFDIAVFNRVYGDGFFGSLLFTEVRTKMGLAYSINGGLYSKDAAGVFEIDLGTRKDGLINALRTITSITQQALGSLPDKQRTAKAQTSLERSFLFRFASPDQIVNRAALLELLHFEKDYDRNYLQRLREVTPDTILAAARKWINLNQLVTVVVGQVTEEQLRQAAQSGAFGLPGAGLKITKFGFDTEPLFPNL